MFTISFQVDHTPSVFDVFMVVYGVFKHYKCKIITHWKHPWICSRKGLGLISQNTLTSLIYLPVTKIVLWAAESGWSSDPVYTPHQQLCWIHQFVRFQWQTCSQHHESWWKWWQECERSWKAIWRGIRPFPWIWKISSNKSVGFWKLFRNFYSICTVTFQWIQTPFIENLLYYCNSWVT